MLPNVHNNDSRSVINVSDKTETGSKCLNCGKSDFEIHPSCSCKLCGGIILQQEWSEHKKVCPSLESSHKDGMKVSANIVEDVDTEGEKNEVDGRDIQMSSSFLTVKSKLSSLKFSLDKQNEDFEVLQRKLNRNERTKMSSKDREQHQADALKLERHVEKNESNLNILEEQSTVYIEKSKRVNVERNKDVLKFQEKESSLSSAVLKLSHNVNDTSKKIDVLEYKNHKGIIMWKIEKFNEKIKEGKDGNYIYLSLPVFTESQEYKFCLSMYVFKENTKKDKYYIAVKINILRSPYNDVLQWPMKRKVLLTLLNPQDRGSNFHKSFYCNFEKPTDRNESKHATGIANFMPLERMQEYIFKPDCVYIKCELAKY